jgi:hypothetical protein
MNGVTATHPESFDNDSDRPVFESLSEVYSLQGVAFSSPNCCAAGFKKV